jgi:hypothetical protein
MLGLLLSHSTNQALARCLTIQWINISEPFDPFVDGVQITELLNLSVGDLTFPSTTHIDVTNALHYLESERIG